MRWTRPRLLLVAAGLGLCVLGLTFLSLRHGWSRTFSASETLRGLGAAAGLGAELEEANGQTILELRLWRALVAIAVGGGLALAGGLLQGLFRNGLASPSVVGVTAGSVLGASIAIALLGGYGAELVPRDSVLFTPALVTGCAWGGAMLVTWTVVSLASSGRRLSVPTLLLAGIAMNTVVGGVLAALQSFTLRDAEVSRAILAWTFGTLEDRSRPQVFLALLGLVLGCCTVPFVRRELDLLATGEEDALALGVPVQRTKALVLGTAAFVTACAVSVAGQIPFVGLVVPHVVRGLFGRAHGAVLPLSVLLGAALLLGCDLLQTTTLSGMGLRPGVLMSLLGGPFFLLLLLRNRAKWSAW